MNNIFKIIEICSIPGTGNRKEPGRFRTGEVAKGTFDWHTGFGFRIKSSHTRTILQNGKKNVIIIIKFDISYLYLYFYLRICD
jgi:hypothetical protein